MSDPFVNSILPDNFRDWPKPMQRRFLAANLSLPDKPQSREVRTLIGMPRPTLIEMRVSRRS